MGAGWKKGKLLKSKKGYGAWRRKLQSTKPNSYSSRSAGVQAKFIGGDTISYGDHAKGDPNVITEDRTKQTYLGLPLSIQNILAKFDGKKDEELPPVIQAMCKLRTAWRSENLGRQGFDNIHRITVLNSENDAVVAVLEGTRGYYLWHDLRKNCVKQSIVYTSEKMRHQWKRFDHDISWDFQDQLRWIDVVFLPSSTSG